jgi:hypothetical protein
MGCNIGALSWNAYMNDLATHIQTTSQQVPVYHFTGNVDVTTNNGQKKDVGDAYFSNTSETLGSILSSSADKIVLVQGNLQLNSSMNTTGYLVVYNTATNPGTILLQDSMIWTHSGAIATEQVDDLSSSNSITWPKSYQFSVVLTNYQYSFYKQSK